MNTHTEIHTVKEISMGTIRFTDQSGVDISFYPSARPGDKLVVSINANNGDVVFVDKVS